MLPAPQEVSPTNHLAEEIYGPLLVGVLFSTLLYGVNIVQSLYRDSVWTRGLVLCLCLCITLKTVLHMVAVYQPLVQQFGRPTLSVSGTHFLFYFRVNTTFKDPVLTGIISTPVQLLMAWRIMVITETRLWTCIIVALAMLSFGASIGTTIETVLKPAFSQFSEFRAAPITWLISSAITDLIITGVLVYSLHVRKSGYNTSLDAYVNHIIRLTIQTGALTAIFALSDALVVVLLKVCFLAWDLSLPNLYLSTILSSLNARDSWTNNGNALLPASSNDVHSQSGLNFWGSMALQNPAQIDIEMQSDLNGEMGLQRNDLVKEGCSVGPELPLSHK
ncbi:hypothetical protein C8J56DRAFT_944699 [Mycena floridula]|nr:hypothetical protein C8J56DRAFT_944529 [Mycena floridula]KAJ7586471.1 hypothetical protein C8J56DRAFT_944699 [Mycena floridula]